MVISYTWMDTYYETNGVASIEYDVRTIDKVTHEEIVIFQGKAWANPETGNVRVNVSKIVRDYLETESPIIKELDKLRYTNEERQELEEKYPDVDIEWSSLLGVNFIGSYTVKHPYASRIFHLDVRTYTGIVTTDYLYILDYSYEHTTIDDAVIDNTVFAMSRPINGHSNIKALKFATYGINMTDPVVQTMVTRSIHARMNAMLLDVKYTNDSCGDYALYYTNRFGGWDTFLIEGPVVKTDSFERHYIEKVYNNQTTEFGKKAYANNAVTTWNMTTGFLTDKEASNFAFNLLSTNKAYLHDLQNDRIYPVNVIESTAEYRTFKNQGRKMVTYSVNLESSQTKENLI